MIVYIPSIQLQKLPDGLAVLEGVGAVLRLLRQGPASCPLRFPGLLQRLGFLRDLIRLPLRLARRGGTVPLGIVQRRLVLLSQAEEALQVLLRVAFPGLPGVGPPDGGHILGGLLQP